MTRAIFCWTFVARSCFSNKCTKLMQKGIAEGRMIIQITDITACKCCNLAFKTLGFFSVPVSCWNDNSTLLSFSLVKFLLQSSSGLEIRVANVQLNMQMCMNTVYTHTPKHWAVLGRRFWCNIYFIIATVKCYFILT